MGGGAAMAGSVADGALRKGGTPPGGVAGAPIGAETAVACGRPAGWVNYSPGVWSPRSLAHKVPAGASCSAAVGALAVVTPL